MGLTYANQAEKNADKALIEQARRALNITESALRLDECELWILQGTRGRITTCGDGERYLLNIYDDLSVRKWSAIKTILTPHMELTQNAQFGGVFYFRLDLPEDTILAVRRYAGLRQALSDEALQERAARARATFHSNPHAPK